jgi:hypothetical protein
MGQKNLSPRVSTTFLLITTTTSLLLPMAPLHKKGDRVKRAATRFDEGSEDRNGERFSLRCAAAGNGTWCFGTIAHVHALTSNPIRTCRVKHDDGESHKSTQAHLFPASLDDDSEGESEAPSRTRQRTTTPMTTGTGWSPTATTTWIPISLTATT